MVVHLFLNNNKDLDFLPINSIKNGGVTQADLSDDLLLILKQMSLLLETLPELIQLRSTLLALEIK